MNLRRKNFCGRAIIFALLACAGALTWRVHTSKCNETLLLNLQMGNLGKARANLNSNHDWEVILDEIERVGDRKTLQAALAVQFEYYYQASEDSYCAYPERPAVIARLINLGASPQFEHLLHATQQGKMKTARLLLRAGVPVQSDGATDTPLANAAYWGDEALVEELLRRGADPNLPSEKGWRPVLAAAWSYQTNCVRCLLRHGADLTHDYELWAGHFLPIWKVIEDRAANNSAAAATWSLVREWRQPPVTGRDTIEAKREGKLDK